MLYVSERAAVELRKRIESSDANEARWRVFVDRRCNCGRVRFGLVLDERAFEGDRRFEVQGLPFVADAETVPQLSFAEVDYYDDWMQRGVGVRNIDQCGSCE